jgi:hypothetical protein
MLGVIDTASQAGDCPLVGLRSDLTTLAATAGKFDPAECTPESVCRIITTAT